MKKMKISGKSCPYLDDDFPDITPYCVLFDYVLNGDTNRCEDCKSLTDGLL